MWWDGNSLWRGTIPGQPCGGTVSYFITAKDFNNNLATGPTLNFTVSAKCACPADIFPVGAGDGTVGPGDLAQLLATWGPCP